MVKISYAQMHRQIEEGAYKRINPAYYGIVDLLKKGGGADIAKKLLPDLDEKCKLRLDYLQKIIDDGKTEEGEFITAKEERGLVGSLRESIDYLITALAGEENLTQEQLANIADKSLSGELGRKKEAYEFALTGR